MNRKFFYKLVLFLAINASIAAGIIHVLQASRPAVIPKNWETEADLPLIPDHGRFDVVLLGASHGRIFSRDKNHLVVEGILGKTVLNLSQGGGAGVVPMHLYLSHFYDRGNQAGTVVYFLDPFVLFSRAWNEDHDCIKGEPFRADFLLKAISMGFSRGPLIDYFQYKFSSNWRDSKGIDMRFSDGNHGSLPGIDSVAVRKRIQSLFLDGMDPKVFQAYCGQLQALLSLARDHGSKMVIVFPSTLLGPLPGTDQVKGYLAGLKNPDVAVFDFTDSIRDPSLFYDHDHLNTSGIELFTRRFLHPALDAEVARGGNAPP